MNQRWRERIGSFRRPDESINPTRYEVAALDEDRIAKSFIQTHHYSGTYPAARFRFGLYRGAERMPVTPPAQSDKVNRLRVLSFSVTR